MINSKQYIMIMVVVGLMQGTFVSAVHTRAMSKRIEQNSCVQVMKRTSARLAARSKLRKGLTVSFAPRVKVRKYPLDPQERCEKREHYAEIIKQKETTYRLIEQLNILITTYKDLNKQFDTLRRWNNPATFFVRKLKLKIFEGINSVEREIWDLERELNQTK